MGGTAIYGAIAGHKAAKKQEQQVTAANQAQAESTQAQMGLSKSLSDYAGSQFRMAQPALSAGLGYYQKLLGGDRATIQGAIAPDVAGINTAYEGTQKYLEQQGVRGGAKDYATAEAERQRVGQIGMLPFLARQGAAGALTQTGLTATGQAMQGLGTAAGAAAGAGSTAYGASGQGFYQGQVRGQQIADVGSNIAGLFANWMQGRGGKSGGAISTGGVLPSTQTVPTMGSLVGS